MREKNNTQESPYKRFLYIISARKIIIKNKHKNIRKKYFYVDVRTYIFFCTLLYTYIDLHLFPFLCLMKIVKGLYFMNFVFNEVFPPDDVAA